MIELAELAIVAEASVLGARRRVHGLATDLGFANVAATRLAIVTSEIGRALLGREDGAALRVGLTAGRNGIVLAFPCGDGSSATRWARFFDTVAREPATDGGALVTGTCALGSRTAVDDAFIAHQRERFRMRSQVELLEEIREQNRALEDHQAALEDTIQERTAEAQAARTAAENASRAKSQFLSNMSHELRTPLNGVLGYAQILRRDPTVVGEQRRSLDAIENCGQHLLTLINDVLDLSKIEAGRLELDPKPTRLEKVVESVRDIVVPRADRHGLKFEITVDPLLPGTLVTDETKLKQVLVNLLGNAVKFTEQGNVGLDIERIGDERVAYHVRDSGIGMTPEEQAHVFQPFRQAEGGRRSGGTGLGLAISRKICEAFGGTLRLESERGVGSCFTAEVPLIVADDVLSDSTMEFTQAGDDDLVLADGQSVVVLVVDDVEVNRDVLVNVLGAAGFTTLTAADGQEALDVLATVPVDIVLMDVRMPVMDGMEATRRIRLDPAIADVKVLAVTADAFSDFRERAAEGGFDGFLAKPLQMAQLFRALRKHLRIALVSRSSAEGGAGAAATRSESGDDATITGAVASALASQLDEAAAMGDIGLFESIAETLDLNGAPGLAARVRDAVADFDFDAAAAVARDLGPVPEELQRE